MRRVIGTMLAMSWGALVVSLSAAAMYVLATGGVMAHAQTRTVPSHPGMFSAAIPDVGATLTEIKAAPTGGQSIYVTDVMLGSSTSTAGTFALRSGTGTNCGTSTTGVIPQPGVSSPTGLISYPANSANVFVLNMTMSIKLPAGHALCVIGSATNLARGQVNGFIAP